MQPGFVQRAVIVADDSMIIRDNLRAALGAPWRIFLAADGGEAVEYARRVQAELVLLDFRMPRLDGVDTCAVIRALPHYAVVPIVLLTAYDSIDLRRRAQRAGATAVFAKPFSTNALMAAVRPLIALGRDAAQAHGWFGPTPTMAVAQINDDLAAGRDVLAVYRKIEAAAELQHDGSFAAVMAARHMKSRR